MKNTDQYKARFEVSATDNRYQTTFHQSEDDARQEAQEQSSREEYKHILFSIHHRTSPRERPRLIGQFENGVFSQGVDLGEDRF
jgi:hypothetical protein